MKRFLIAATAAIGLLGAAGAASAAPGDVIVNGSVAAACSALNSSTITVGELANPATGTVVAAFGGTPNTTLSFRCNTPASKFTITASPLLTNAGVAPTGYTATVNYTAAATPTLTGGAGSTVSCTTSSNCPQTGLAQTGYLSAAANNVAVVVSAPTATGLLIMGSYTGTITVTISPT